MAPTQLLLTVQKLVRCAMFEPRLPFVRSVPKCSFENLPRPTLLLFASRVQCGDADPICNSMHRPGKCFEYSLGFHRFRIPIARLNSFFFDCRNFYILPE